MELICFEHVYKTYGQGEGEVHALDDVSFSVKEGGVLCPSGCLRRRQDDTAESAGRHGSGKRRNHSF